MSASALLSPTGKVCPELPTTSLTPGKADATGTHPAAMPSSSTRPNASARVLVHEAVADTLLERLAGAVATLQVGPASDLGTDVPPVIEREAQERILRMGAEAAAAGRVVARQEDVPDRGWYCPPTVVADLPDDAAVLRDEVFGPLLAISRVRSIDEALDVVHGLPFALTGGLFSRDPAVVEHVRHRTPVGNLYVNRNITGAMVGRQPFGGNRLSGTGTKAGGPDYLLGFVEPRVITENTMRHGLVVE